MTVAEVAPRSLSAPPGGEWWRFYNAWRGPPAQRGQIIGELTDIRTRKIHLDLYGPATAQFVVDGRSPQCAGLQELSQDVLAYRWDPDHSTYVLTFRGPIGRTTDTISETTHTVTVDASDGRALLARCYTNTANTFAQIDQSNIVATLIAPFTTTAAAPWNQGFSFAGTVNPDGTSRGPTGMLRDRTYTGAEKVGDMVDRLSLVINGFDWSAEPGDPITGAVTVPYAVYVWYPQRGATLPQMVAEYGVNVASVSRTVNSSDFANWVRFDGTNTAPGDPIYATSPGDVMTNPHLHAEGMWQDQQSTADVSVTATLQQQADGYLNVHSVIVPAYTLKLVPGTWHTRRDCWVGNIITLRIASGRLNVNTTVRVVTFDFDIDDNGVERISLGVGRPATTLASILGDQQSTIDALTRR